MTDKPFSDVHLKPNYNSPSPQADDLEKVIETLEGIIRGGWGVASWCEYYGFNERQYDYYVNALRWLGFLKGTPAKHRSTSLGLIFIKDNISGRRSLLQRILLQDPVFSQTAEQHMKIHRVFAESKIIEYQDLWNVNVGSSTIKRRALTVSSWLKTLKLGKI